MDGTCRSYVQLRPPSPRRILQIALGILLAVALVILVLGVWATQPVLCWQRDQPVVGADPERLRVHVRKLSVEFFPRSSEDPTNLTRCAEYIRAQFAAAGAQVSNQYYVCGGQGYKITGRRTWLASSTNESAASGYCVFENVIARFGPATGACVIVGAHYDTCCRFPGADDNASGIAGLLELARLLGQAQPPSTPILLVAYCTEEPPNFGTAGMGSYQHAKLLKRAGVDVKAMLALEMIGCFRDECWSQQYPVPLLYAIYPTRGNFIAVVGTVEQRGLIRTVKCGMQRASSLPVWSGSLPRALPGIDFSDHRSYWAFGFPAVMVTDTAFFRNHAYHQKDDTWDKLDYARMADVVTGVKGALGALCMWPPAGPTCDAPGDNVDGAP